HCPRTPLSSVVQVRSGLVWGFSCQAVVLGCADSFLFGAGKAVFRPVACNQVPGARGRGQGTETLAELGGLPPSVACVSQRPRPSPGQALTPEHAEGRLMGVGTQQDLDLWPMAAQGADQ